MLKRTVLDRLTDDVSDTSCYERLISTDRQIS